MAKNNKNTRKQIRCIGPRQFSTVVILSATSLLLPSALSIASYWLKWIPEAQAQDPIVANKLKLALGLSAGAAGTVTIGTLLWLRSQKCI